MGKHDIEAANAFAAFEKAAAAKTIQPSNANVELVMYYVDRAYMPGKAVEVASHDYSWRRDIYTLDAYAWALHAIGNDDEARKQIETALAVGVQDTGMFYHAGEIALKLGDRVSAERYLKRSRNLNNSDPEQAQKAPANVAKAAD